jgi:hypothetical protein
MTGWPTSQDYISQTLDVIDFLASRYIMDNFLDCQDTVLIKSYPLACYFEYLSKESKF